MVTKFPGNILKYFMIYNLFQNVFHRNQKIIDFNVIFLKFISHSDGIKIEVIFFF